MCIRDRFEDFEADAMGMTEHIYKALSIPGFAEARADIEKYVGCLLYTSNICLFRNDGVGKLYGL